MGYQLIFCHIVTWPSFLHVKVKKLMTLRLQLHAHVYVFMISMIGSKGEEL